MQRERANGRNSSKQLVRDVLLVWAFLLVEEQLAELAGKGVLVSSWQLEAAADSLQGKSIEGYIPKVTNRKQGQKIDRASWGDRSWPLREGNSCFQATCSHMTAGSCCSFVHETTAAAAARL